MASRSRNLHHHVRANHVLEVHLTSQRAVFMPVSISLCDTMSLFVPNRQLWWSRVRPRRTARQDPCQDSALPLVQGIVNDTVLPKYREGQGQLCFLGEALCRVEGTNILLSFFPILLFKATFDPSGAREAINILSSTNQPIWKLVLSHNPLQEDGCVELLEFLSTRDGRKHPIRQLDLERIGLGDRGLLALSKYMDNNDTLKQLSLQNVSLSCLLSTKTKSLNGSPCMQNKFGLDPVAISAFVTAVNASSITNLLMNSNRNGPKFISWMLDTLDNTSLRVLNLSRNELTDAHTSPLVRFLVSPRCRLSTLHLNGNHFSFHSVKAINDTLVENVILTTLECYVNNFGAHDQRFMVEQTLKNLRRNGILCGMVGQEAVDLLRYSQIILLGSKGDNSGFKTLPVEIILQILSFLGPTLSERQRMRVINCAADRQSLLPESDIQKTDWLSKVGCDSYDPDESNRAALLRIRS